MIRTTLLLLAFISVFIALASWLYLILAFVLWILVFGDDSTTFGYYALAVAVPLSLVLSLLYLRLAIRWPFSTSAMIATIIAAVILESLFVIAIRS